MPLCKRIALRHRWSKVTEAAFASPLMGEYKALQPAHIMRALLAGSALKPDVAIRLARQAALRCEVLMELPMLFAAHFTAGASRAGAFSARRALLRATAITGGVLGLMLVLTPASAQPVD
jgi:hypothetical protein